MRKTAIIGILTLLCGWFVISSGGSLAQTAEQTAPPSASAAAESSGSGSAAKDQSSGAHRSSAEQPKHEQTSGGHRAGSGESSGGFNPHKRIGLPEPPKWFDRTIGWIARGIETLGIFIILLGIVVSTVRFVWRIVRRDQGFNEAYHQYRGNLGRGILLGLELLVAADIIGTVAVAPTFYNLGVLAVIVLIRTFLSFSLEVEINGRWPWQQAKAKGENDDHRMHEM